MKTVLKAKWLVLALWIAAAVILMLTAPNIAELVKEKGQINVPEGYSSSVAAELSQNMRQNNSENANTASTLLVFHEAGGLTQEHMGEIGKGLEKLGAAAAEGNQGIVSLVTHLGAPELASQMLSEDGTTAIALLTVDLGVKEPSVMQSELEEMLSDVSVEYYLTGDWVINQDLIQSSQDGLKRTEIITVILIVVILFLVFRSVVAPFIPLLTVGISYLVSQSVVAFLVDFADFPLSTYTQIFMVAVMFGIGTDYCILLISRFKEELSHQSSTTEAILATYRSAGRTVLYSGLAVLVGFTSIGFSTFTLYRSAVAVAVGVAVLLLALVTLVPFFMAVLQKVLFWPTKKTLEHTPSKLWGHLGRFSLKRPLISIIVIAIVVLPFLGLYKNEISFNSLDEIGEKYDSVKGFNLVAERFGPGETLPTTVMIEWDEPLAMTDGLAAIESISQGLSEVDDVSAVRSASRPTGEPIDLTQMAGSSDPAMQQQFQQMLATYMSSDMRIASFDVVFGTDPYSTETMDHIDVLQDQAEEALASAGYPDAEVAIGGVTSVNNDLRHISGEDYNRTAIMMMIGIALILIILFRSLIIPLYMMASLILTFYTSMAVTELIFMRWLDYSGISWAVPFFGFVMLMALGIDYSIFLMDRFKEYRTLNPKEAIILAMENMGKVIMSAAAILGGTFAAMLPSGVMSLLQIATVLISGLLLYAFIMLPLFIPVMVRVFGRYNGWPFMKKRKAEPSS
ncbi:MMPL family transporter [Marinicrinis lubricantis]|uniref:MMPL family transporter n=1 Tax=Marinicrinis lubricantis TaxID=2086470 RepID=A0ABW1IS07_9BACL